MQSWVHLLEWRATTHPERPALADDHGAEYTYGGLLAAVESHAGGWARLGIRDGDVVAIVAHNSAAFLLHTLALQRAGAIPAFINWRVSAQEFTDIFARCAPVAVLADADFLETVNAVAAPTVTAMVSLTHPPEGSGWHAAADLAGPVPPRPAHRLAADGVFGLMHTGGTSGRTKIIPLVNSALLRTISGFAIEIGDQHPGARHLQLMPLYHLAGFAQAMQCLLTAGTLLLHTGFDAAAVIDAIERDRVEFFTAAPTLIDMLITEVHRRPQAPDLSSVREIAYGAAPITPPLLRAALDVFHCRFRQIYGNTECQSFVSLLAPADHHPENPNLASAGQIALGWEVRVTRPDGTEAGPNELGELWIRGASLFDGYWGDPHATAKVLTADGWYRTGDIVQLTPERYLYILDRANDMIITGGENVYPAQVEAVLAEHPAIAEIAVIGAPDSRWGETVHAVVVPQDGAAITEGELIAWGRERLARFKCPRTVELVGDLPRTSTGKVLKRELRTHHH
jgi:acyl-CoA synthetase (AMP-forming)/AMP-acid ligase II